MPAVENRKGIGDVMPQGTSRGHELQKTQDSCTENQQNQPIFGDDPDFHVYRSDDVCGMPLRVIRHLNKMERNGEAAIVMHDHRGGYTLYLDHVNVAYTLQWDVRAHSPRASPMISAALRWNDDSNIVAMTSRAKRDVASLSADIAMWREADRANACRREAAIAERERLQLAMRQQAEQATFRRAQFTPPISSRRSDPLIALIYAGMAIHPSLPGPSGVGKGVALSHLSLGANLVPYFRTQRDAKIAAARLTRVTDMVSLGRFLGAKQNGDAPADIKLLMEIIAQMRNPSHGRYADPLAAPELDAHLYPASPVLSVAKDEDSFAESPSM